MRPVLSTPFSQPAVGGACVVLAAVVFIDSKFCYRFLLPTSAVATAALPLLAAVASRVSSGTSFRVSTSLLYRSYVSSILNFSFRICCSRLSLLVNAFVSVSLDDAVACVSLSILAITLLYFLRPSAEISCSVAGS